MFSPKKLHKEHSNKEATAANDQISTISVPDAFIELPSVDRVFSDTLTKAFGDTSFWIPPTIDRTVVVSRKPEFLLEITAESERNVWGQLFGFRLEW